jgi:MFS family permease
MSDTTATRPAASMGYSYFVVGFLAVIYTLNFLDRQIVSILGKQISADLGLSKTEFGFLGGTSFALLYTTAGIAVAWLADRVSRKWIIGISCAIWSLFTALCGTAQNFTQILLYRMGVGFGEAGGSPPSYSMISDYFPAEKRGTALALYSLGVPVGSMLGAFFAGQLALAYGWRMAFVIIGLPGVVLGILMLSFVREPKRGGLDLGQAWHAITASSGSSFVHETEGQLILNGSYDIAFTMDLALKDLGFAMNFGKEFGVPLDLASMTQQTFMKGKAAYGGAAQSTQIAKLLEDVLNTDLRAPGFPARLE